jgi:hypothetical protein
MFRPDIHSLRLDPDLHVAVRPFVEIESVGLDPPIRQRYFSKRDNGTTWRVGCTLVNIDDEKVPGLQWKIIKRWFHVPAFQLNFTNDLTEVQDTTGEVAMPGDGPYVAMYRHMIQKLRAEYDRPTGQ